MSDIFSRYREDNSREDTALDYFQSSNGVNSSGYFQSSRKGDKNSMEDNSNPGWRKAMRQGNVVMSGMRLQKQHREFTPGNLAYSETGYGIVWSGDMCGMVEAGFDAGSQLDQYVDQLRNIVLTEALAKVNDSSLQTGEFIKDFTSTVSMLKKPFASAQLLLTKIERKAQRKLSRQRRKQLIRANDAMSRNAVVNAYSDAWLELQYGWKPVILDIETIYNSSAALDGSFHRRKVVRAFKGDSYKASNSFEGVSFASPLDVLLGDGVSNVEASLRMDAGVIFDFVNRNRTVTGSQFFGVRARDLPVTFWQVTPYSFVIDWFLNVETWIKASTPHPDVILRGNWTTCTLKKQRRVSGTSRYEWPTNPPQTITGSLGTSLTTSTLVERETNRLISALPVLTYDALTLTQTISGLSLMVRPLINGLMKIAQKMR